MQMPERSIWQLLWMNMARQPGSSTMEDILEEIVGDILDEYDEDEITIRAQKDNSLIIDGLAYLEDVEEELDADFGDSRV